MEASQIKEVLRGSFCGKTFSWKGKADGTKRACEVKRIYETRCMKAWTFFDYSTGWGLSLEIPEGRSMQITGLLRPHLKQDCFPECRWQGCGMEQNLIPLTSNVFIVLIFRLRTSFSTFPGFEYFSIMHIIVLLFVLYLTVIVWSLLLFRSWQFSITCV